VDRDIKYIVSVGKKQKVFRKFNKGIRGAENFNLRKRQGKR